jgi:hypothetical protein
VIVAAVVAATVLVFAGCEPSGTSDIVLEENGQARVGPAVETETVSRAVAPGDRTLVLKGFRGTVMLEGTTASTAELEFVKRGLGGTQEEAQEHLGGVRVTEEGTAEEYVYTVEADDEDRSAADVRGSIPDGVKLRVEHAAGAVSILGVTGPIRVEHEHGPVDVRDAEAGVNVEIKNGDITVQYRVLPATASVSLSTANGDMELALPPEASVQVDAETSVGEIFVRGLTFDPQRLTPRRAGARYVAQRGAGDVTATLRTENGSIVIRNAPPVLPDDPAADTLASPADTSTAPAPADTLPSDTPDDTTSRQRASDTAPGDTATGDTAPRDTATGDTTRGVDAEMPPPDRLDPPTPAPDTTG